jgi:hypothetical protein
MFYALPSAPTPANLIMLIILINLINILGGIRRLPPLAGWLHSLFAPHWSATAPRELGEVDGVDGRLTTLTTGATQ